jgi:hypothetical protein
MSIRNDNWLITPLDNQQYFVWNDSLSLISPFVGRRFQELENCKSSVREIVLAAPHAMQQGNPSHDAACQHAFYLFSCGTCQMFGEPACNAKPAAIYYLWYSFLKKVLFVVLPMSKEYKNTAPNSAIYRRDWQE